MFIALLICISTSILAAEDPIPILDLMRALQDTEGVVTGLAVSSRIETVDFPRTGNGPAKITRSIESQTVVADGRIKWAQQTLGKGEAVDSVRVEVFDGQEFRSISGRAEKIESGLINPSTSDHSWINDAWDLTSRYTGYKVSEIIRTQGIEEYSALRRDARTVYRIRTRPYGEHKELRNEFLIDPSRGFAVLRKSSSYHDSKRDEWFEFRSMQGDEYTEVAPQIWLPGRNLSEVYNSDRSAQRLKQTYVNEGWRIDPPLDAQVFKLDFPKNTFVEDNVKNTSYITTKITDQDIIDLTTISRSFKPIEGDGKSGRGASHSYVAILMFVAAFTFVTAFVFLARRRKAAPKKPEA